MRLQPLLISSRSAVNEMTRSDEQDGFPNLTTTSSIMASCLRADPNLYHQYANIRTSRGYSFDDHVQVGVDDPDGVGCGCCCVEEDSYKYFHEFYHTLICTSQAENEPIRSVVCHRLNVLNLEDYRYSIDYNYIKDVQVQTRRNISGFALSPKCSRAERRKIFNLVDEAFQLQYPEGPSLMHLYDISLEQKRKLQAVGEFLEKPDSRSLCARSGGSRDWPDGRGILFLPDSCISVWVNEEDSIRIFARETEPSTNIVTVLEKVADCEVYLEKALCDIGGWSYMHCQHFGYLTADPTRLGVLEVKATIGTVAIHGRNTYNALLQLCNKFQVNLHYDPFSPPSGEGKGITFDLLTRPAVFCSEDERIGRFLECVKAIIRLDEYVIINGDSEVGDFVLEIISSPVACSWRELRSDSVQSGGSSLLSPRRAMSLLSVISPMRWNGKEKDEGNREYRPCMPAFCCAPLTQHGDSMVSDPLLLQCHGGTPDSPSRKRRVSYDEGRGQEGKGKDPCHPPYHGDYHGEERALEGRQAQAVLTLGQNKYRRNDLPSIFTETEGSFGGGMTVEGSSYVPSRSPMQPQQDQASPFRIERRNIVETLSDVSDFPFFPRGATSLLSRHLTKATYLSCEHKRTSLSNCSLSELIRPGTENPRLRIGVVAGDEECYELFSPLFDPIISSLHKFTPGSTSQLRDAQPMKLGGILGIDMSYTKAARVQASRNVKGYPLALMISRADRRQLEKVLRGVLERLVGPLKGKYYPLAELTVKQVRQLRERNIHIDKPAAHSGLEISGCNRDWPDGRGIFINDSMDFAVLTNHSDHLLVISLDSSNGYIISAFERWSVGMMLIEGFLNNTPFQPCSLVKETKGCRRLDESPGEKIGERGGRRVSGEWKAGSFEFQYSERLGYIACSPQNLGTGLYSSITIELPELGLQEDSLKIVCENIGLRAVNMSSIVYEGEGTEEERRARHREWVEEDGEDEGEEEEGDRGERGGEETKEVDEEDTRSKPGRREGREEVGFLSLCMPSKRTLYEISNKDCMGQSEVQLTQKVIDGVSAIIEIEKKIEDGSRIDDFVKLPETPSLPAPPLCKVASSSSLIALVLELEANN